MEEPFKLKLFVRWCKNHDDAGGRVELMKEDGTVVFFSDPPCGNNDRVYGYCRAIIDLFRVFGIEIEMPNCLKTSRLFYNRSRED